MKKTKHTEEKIIVAVSNWKLAARLRKWPERWA